MSWQERITVNPRVLGGRRPERDPWAKERGYFRVPGPSEVKKEKAPERNARTEVKDEKPPAGNARIILTHSARFAAFYALYVAVLYPVVSSEKMDGIWLIGLLFASAVTYLVHILKPVDRSG